MADASYDIRYDKQECNVGETVLFKANNGNYFFGMFDGSGNNVSIYEDNVLLASNVNIWNGYEYTPSTSGVHTIKIDEYGYYITKNITVNAPTPKVFDHLSIDGYEVSKIEFYTTANNGGGVVLTKIDTKFVRSKGMFLLDVNDNPLNGKTVHIEDKSGTYDVITDSTGQCTLQSVLSAVFDGDDQYNGCNYP